MSSGKTPRSLSQRLLLSLEDKSHDGNRIRRRNMAPSANHWNNSNMGQLRTAFAENSRKGYDPSLRRGKAVQGAEEHESKSE